MKYKSHIVVAFIASVSAWSFSKLELETHRQEDFKELCRNFSNIQVYDLASDKLVAKIPIRCMKQAGKNACAIGSENVQKSFPHQTKKYYIPLGIDSGSSEHGVINLPSQRMTLTTDNKIILVNNFYERDDVEKSYFRLPNLLDDDVPNSCFDIEN